MYLGRYLSAFLSQSLFVYYCFSCLDVRLAVANMLRDDVSSCITISVITSPSFAVNWFVPFSCWTPSCIIMVSAGIVPKRDRFSL